MSTRSDQGIMVCTISVYRASIHVAMRATSVNCVQRTCTCSTKIYIVSVQLARVSII